ncbi:MAG: hypothetical protein ACE5ES_02490 [Candidatus Nanoarchaeia archaeon]
MEADPDRKELLRYFDTMHKFNLIRLAGFRSSPYWEVRRTGRDFQTNIPKWIAIEVKSTEES